MAERTNRTGDLPPGPPSARGGEDDPEYRKISREELNRIVWAHAKWLESDGEDGQQASLELADLSGCKLKRVDLSQAIFQRCNLDDVQLDDAELHRASFWRSSLCGTRLYRANLTNASLRGANLSEAGLADAKLGEADLIAARVNKASLTRADLRGAKLQGAKFGGANLSDVSGIDEAILQDVDLKDATGLSGKQFAGTDLTGAVLPDSIAGFEGLAHVAETSQNARKIFFGLLLGCVYAWLTMATTTDARLLTNSASSPLPIIQTEIPIAWFYWAAPLILLSVYFYFHLYLLRLWEGLASLPAIFPDGKPLDQRAYPWLLNGLVCGHIERLRENRPALSRLQNLVSILLAWWFVPVTLLAFWLRYLPRQDWPGTILMIGYVVAAAGFGMTSYLLARRMLRAEQAKFSWARAWRDGRSFVAAATAALALGVLLFSYGAIEAEPAAYSGARAWLPQVCERHGCAPYPFANLREATLSTRPADWWKADEEAKRDLEGIVGADLRGASLRGASASQAFLAKSRLKGADLREADLRGANLLGATLVGARLHMAELSGAVLAKADLSRADLQDANLSAANLQEARLTGANLTKADLVGADLRQAVLEDADFQAANLTEADLRGVDLAKVHLEAAILFHADLRGADFREANIRGAELSGADLRGGIFWDEDLSGDNFKSAHYDACQRLTATRHWPDAHRDEALACGQRIPPLPPESRAGGPAN